MKKLFIFMMTFCTFAIRAATLQEHIEELKVNGVTVIENAFTLEEIETFNEEYMPIRDAIFDLMENDPGQRRVFKTDTKTTVSRYWMIGKDFVLQAGEGRYDSAYGMHSGLFASDMFMHQPDVEDVMKEMLVSEYTNYAGMVYSKSGSGKQYWHRDTANIAHTDRDGSKLIEMDDFYFTVLIPLVSLNEENGTTEFQKGTHLLPASDFDNADSLRFDVPVGSVIIFNGKINHRGRENNSMNDRPVLYQVYHKKWYNEGYREGLEDN